MLPVYLKHCCQIHVSTVSKTVWGSSSHCFPVAPSSDTAVKHFFFLWKMFPLVHQLQYTKKGTTQSLIMSCNNVQPVLNLFSIPHRASSSIDPSSYCCFASLQYSVDPKNDKVPQLVLFYFCLLWRDALRLLKNSLECICLSLGVKSGVVFVSCLIYPESVSLRRALCLCSQPNQGQCSTLDFDLELTWKKQRERFVGEAVAVDEFWSDVAMIRPNWWLIIYVGSPFKQYYWSMI